MNNKLLIIPITKSYAKILNIKKTKKIIQNKSFRLGVKIENVGKNRFEGGLIKNIKLFPALKVQNIVLKTNKTFKIKPLKSGEQIEIWFDIFNSVFCGNIWIELKIKPKRKRDKILTYQWNETSRGMGGPESTNSWHNPIFVFNENTVIQQTTNYLLLLLTLVILIDQIFGTKNILTSIINAIGFALKLLV